MAPETDSRAVHAGGNAASAVAPAPELGAWWRQADALVAQAPWERADLTRAAYRFGEATLELETDVASVVRGLDAFFSECSISGRDGATVPRVRFSLRAVPATELVAARIDAPVAFDLMAIGRSLLEPRPGANCFEHSAASSGWRCIGRLPASSSPLLAVKGRTCLFRTSELPQFFLRDFALGAALTIQKDTVFLHAASLSLGAGGALLAGRGGSGKTTLALALASRGHGLLGDDMAALRLDTLELLPFRRTLRIRRGLRAREVDRALQDAARNLTRLEGAAPRVLAEPRQLFPASCDRPAVLRAAFFLRGFRRQPGIERFVPSLGKLDALQALPIRLQWGVAPGRRLLRFARVLEALARIPNYFLDVGRPEETAALVERTLEAS